MFMLHQRLQEDTVDVVRLGLSRVLLMNDSSFPWLILVPEREGTSEIYELNVADRAVLIEEIAIASEIIRQLYSPDKINAGALGNLVPQLHIHVIGRFRTDRAWPGPVWGTGPAQPYAEEELDIVSGRLKKAFEQRVASDGGQ
ncbi:MAG: HIT family protein [Nitrospirota bacterium]|nr:HIT family protein [Nitrospirota bacterium]